MNSLTERTFLHESSRIMAFIHSEVCKLLCELDVTEGYWHFVHKAICHMVGQYRSETYWWVSKLLFAFVWEDWARLMSKTNEQH